MKHVYLVAALLAVSFPARASQISATTFLYGTQAFVNQQEYSQAAAAPDAQPNAPLTAAIEPASGNPVPVKVYPAPSQPVRATLHPQPDNLGTR